MPDRLQYSRMHRQVLAAIFLFGVGLVPAAAEEGNHGFEYGEFGALFEEPPEKTGHIDLGPVDVWYDGYAKWKEDLEAQTGISFLIEDRFINIWGEDAQIHDNELNLIARWEFLSGEGYGTNSVNVWGQFAQSVGGTTGSEFQADLGILSPLCGCNGGPDTTNEILQMLAFEHITPNDRFRFQAGKVAMRTLVNLNRYANGDSEMFFSPMLGNNTVAPYTALLGLGMFGQWKEEYWYLSGVVRAPDVETGISFDALEEGDLAYIGEFALTPTIPGLGYGEYRFTYSFDQATGARPEVSTIGLSFDQDIGEYIGAFFKYNYSDDTFRSFDTQVAGGFQIKKPFGFAYDRIGIGAWMGDPADPSLRTEHGIELYYKAQVAPFLEITPDIQFVFDPANSGNDFEVTGGVRFRGVL